MGIFGFSNKTDKKTTKVIKERMSGFDRERAAPAAPVQAPMPVSTTKVRQTAHELGKPSVKEKSPQASMVDRLQQLGDKMTATDIAPLAFSALTSLVFGPAPMIFSTALAAANFLGKKAWDSMSENERAEYIQNFPKIMADQEAQRKKMAQQDRSQREQEAKQRRLSALLTVRYNPTQETALTQKKDMQAGPSQTSPGSPLMTKQLSMFPYFTGARGLAGPAPTRKSMLIGY